MHCFVEAEKLEEDVDEKDGATVVDEDDDDDNDEDERISKANITAWNSATVPPLSGCALSADLK